MPLSHDDSLAWAELYIAIADIFRRFDWQLYGTVKERDVDNVRDCFTGDTSHESRGVRAKLSRSSKGVFFSAFGEYMSPLNMLWSCVAAQYKLILEGPRF